MSWDSRGLEIEAYNSSLNQILRQVAADTGAKLEGLTQDQRVFGSYGLRLRGATCSGSSSMGPATTYS